MKTVGYYSVVSIIVLVFIWSIARSMMPTSAEPDEPCVAEGDDAAARRAAQDWCTGGVFTHVVFRSSAHTLTAMMQFSQKGMKGWASDRSQILTGLRRLSSDLTSQADVNVAFSIHDRSGTLIGGCAQRRGDRKATCKP